MKRHPTPAPKRPPPGESPTGQPLRGRLSAEEITAREEQRKLPSDNNGRETALDTADRKLVATLNELLDESGYMPSIERCLRAKRGKQSSLSPRAFLLGTLYIGGVRDSNWRTKLNAFLNALHPQDAVDLGLQSVDGEHETITYNVTCKQGTKIEQALWGGWTDPDEGTERDIVGFAEALIRAILPEELRWRIADVAIDPTDFPSWATQHLSLERAKTVTEADIAELNKTVRPRKGTKRRQFKRTNGLIGQRRRDGKVIISKTPGVGIGHRSAASGRPEGTFCGNYLTVAVAVKSRRVTRNPKKASFGPDVPPFIVGVDLCAAGTSAATTSLSALASAERLCGKIIDVVVDRGISQLYPTFNRPVHRQNRHITMDMKSDQLRAATPVKLGPSGYPAYSHGGTLLHAYTPKKYRVPPKNLSDKELKAFYGEREKFALTVNQHLANGDKQFESPFRNGCIGKMAYPKPSDFDKHFRKIPDQVLHKRYINVTAEELDRFQQPHYGTAAHWESYLRRLQSENAIAQLKSGGGLNNKTCRVLNDGARFLTALARIVSYNLEERRKYEEALQEAKTDRRAANKTRPKHYIPQRFVAPCAVNPESPDNDSPEIAEPRAPP